MSAFSVRGVNEGFYGPPWPHEQRLRMIELLGQWGMTDFLVAPKDDPWHRIRWRDPFTGEQLASLAALVDHGRTHGITIGVALGPGLTICYSDAAECTALLHRAQQLHDIGVGRIALLLDDIAPTLQHEQDRDRYEDIVEAHLDLLRRFRDGLATIAPALPLAVCPMVYRGTGAEDYIVRFGAGMPDDVDLMWTGRQICSETLTTEDAAAFAASTGHRPLYWDNYPVNDVAMTYELHIGPLRGRSVDLGGHCTGLLANPMPAFHASLIPLHTIAAYLLEPEEYDPDAAWLEAVAAAVPDADDRAAFVHFGRCVQDSCLNDDAMPDEGPRLAQAAFWWRTGELRLAHVELQAMSDRIGQASTRLRRADFCAPQLQRDIAPWVVKYAKGGRALSAMAEAVRLAEARPLVDGQPDCGPEGLGMLRSALQELQADRYRVFGDGLEMTLAELLEEFEWVSHR